MNPHDIAVAVLMGIVLFAEVKSYKRKMEIRRISEHKIAVK